MVKWLSRMNLIQKLVVFFVFLIVIPILVAYWIVSVKVAKITEDQMGDTLFQLVKTSHLTLDRDVMSVDGTTEKLMFTPETQLMFDTTELSEYDRLQKYLVLDKLLTNYSKSGVNFSVFIPELADGYPFAPASSVKENGVFFSCDLSPSGWFQTAINARGTGIIRVMNELGNNPHGVKTAAYIRGMSNNTLGDRTIAGVLVMTGLDSLLQKDLESLKIPKDGQIVLLDKSNSVLANTAGLEIGGLFSLPKQIFRSSEGVYIDRDDKESWLYAIHTSENSDTKLLFKIPIRSIIGQHESMRELVNYLMIVYFCILLLASIYFFRHILSPLSRLARLSRSFEPGRPLTNEYKVKRGDEIGLLNNAFIEMTKRLNQTIHDKYDLELKHKEAELTILHSQINPHLLYNTLESIFWRTTIEGNEESAEMIRDLSLLMRIGLSRGKTLIPISEELKHIEAYVRLQQKRNNYEFKIHWDIEERTKSYLIPKVVMQPLVENAILHGIRKMNNEGELWISIKGKDEQVEIRIGDNGYRAADIGKLNAIANGELPEMGFGIQNVNRRIKLHFGEGYGLVFEARPEGGTYAVMIIPANAEETQM
ncbi:sensor histidine kinase [Cohnella endophytica]|uniref:Sensor histidine kinase n=1 Tax=Cohnella endophytica TaxID=2419778 RepID=A0A494X859_9BACL|nr:histidine kinase [Cohnella endophytica]RKP46738.1 sensor histidine kinase [Cohnella endophytica]